jgi:hypothetical protein
MKIENAVVGVDPSSVKLALVAGTDDGVPVSAQTVYLPKDRVTAYRLAYRFGRKVAARNPRRVVIEAPVMGRGGIGGTLPQVYVSGAFQAGLASLGHPALLANNSQWKKVVCGKGNIDKAGIVAWVRSNFPEVYDRLVVGDGGRVDQDVADAICIYLYGVRHLRVTDKIDRHRSRK